MRSAAQKIHRLPGDEGDCRNLKEIEKGRDRVEGPATAISAPRGRIERDDGCGVLASRTCHLVIYLSNQIAQGSAAGRTTAGRGPAMAPVPYRATWRLGLPMEISIDVIGVARGAMTGSARSNLTR